MCGILGILDPTISSWPEDCPALDLIRHRGPDDRGRWSAPGIFLAQARLAIIDLSPAGHQPFLSRDGRHVLVFNGELYNYLELREELRAKGRSFETATDTEVLLHAYAEWGPACLPRFEGMFAFAVWDRSENTLFLARDRCGEKPLYYRRLGKRFAFASELKGLLALAPSPGGEALDPTGVSAFLHHQFVPEPRTILHGVHKLPPGHSLLLHPGAPFPAPIPFWSLRDVPPCDAPDPVEAIDRELARATLRTLRSDVPVGISLSGGLDSSALAVLAQAHNKQTLQAFSVGYPGEPENDERAHAKALAARLGMPFHPVELPANTFVDEFPELIRMMDDPIGDIAAYGYFSIARAARERGVKVLISGIGGDELFWGYEWVRRAVALSERKATLANTHLPRSLARAAGHAAHLWPLRQLRRSKRMPPALRRLSNSARDLHDMDLAHPAALVFDACDENFGRAAKAFRLAAAPAFARTFGADHVGAASGLTLEPTHDIPVRICDTLFRNWLTSNCLALSDRTSMASAVELRLPLLYPTLIDTVFGLRRAKPDHALPPKHLFKQVLRRYLPDEVLTRRKRGFSPPGIQWMRALADRHAPSLPSGVLAREGVLSRKGLDALLRSILTSNRSLDFTYRLILLETWCARFGVSRLAAHSAP